MDRQREACRDRQTDRHAYTDRQREAETEKNNYNRLKIPLYGLMPIRLTQCHEVEYYTLDLSVPQHSPAFLIGVRKGPPITPRLEEFIFSHTYM